MSDEKREQSEPAEEAPAAGAPEHDPPLDDLDDEARAVLDEEGGPVLDEVDVRELLRSALAPPKGAVAPALLQGVQRRIRTRSRGKFYGDGWSTAKSPRSTYLVTSLLMLVLIGFVFFVLVPWGGGALPTP
jgi:hypothetical protein